MPSFRAIIGHQISKIYKLSPTEHSDLVDALARLQSQSFSNLNVIKYEHLLVEIINLLDKQKSIQEAQASKGYVKILQIISQSEPMVQVISLIAIICFLKRVHNPFFATNTLNILAGSKNYAVKSCALNALSMLSDSLDFNYIESNLQLSLHSKDAIVQSSTMILIRKISNIDKKFCSRWTDEIVEVLNNSSNATFMAALNALYIIKQHDVNFIAKTLENCNKKSLDSFSIYSMINTIQKLTPVASHKNITFFKDILKKVLKSVRFTVATEASAVILNNLEVYHDLAAQAMKHLSILSGSSNPLNRFSTAKILCKVLYSQKIDENDDEEFIKNVMNILTKLVSDEVQSVSILALSAYLKGASISLNVSESQLMKNIDQIASHYSKMAVEYKIGLISSFKIFGTKFENLRVRVVNLLAEWLFVLDLDNVDHSRDCDKVIADMLLYFLETSLPKETISTIIGALSQFIEECELVNNSINVINSLGSISAKFSQFNAAKIIASLFNVLILADNLSLKESALYSLMKMGLSYPEMQDTIINFYEKIQQNESPEIVVNANICINALRLETKSDYFDKCFRSNFVMDVNPLLDHVEKHLKNESLDEELDLSDFQLLPSNIDENSVKIKSADEEMIPALFKNLDVQSAIQSKDISEDEINGILIKIQENIPDITSFLKICQQKPLNEKNNEIYIAYNLVFSKDHLILLFSIENTVENLMLKNLKLQFNSIPENSSIVYQESIESIKFGTSKKLITVLKFSDIVDLTECDIDFISNFDAHDFDPKSNQVSPFGSEEEYTFPSLIVELPDVLLPLKMKKTEFVNCWKSLTTQQQIQPTNEIIPLPKQKGDAKQILQSQSSIMEYFGFPWSSVSTKNNEIGFSSKTMDGNALLVTLSISDRGKKDGHNLEGNVLCSDKSYTELIVNDLFSN